jgi:integrase
MSSELVQYTELRSTKDLPADQHPGAVYLSSLASGSLPGQRSALNKIAETVGLDAAGMNWGALRYQHVQFIRARLAERYSATTANKILSALRRVLREAWKLGYMPESEYRKVADIQRIKVDRDDVEDELMGRALTQGELTAMMGTCVLDQSKAGVRDAAIIALGYSLGLRRAEIAKMEIDHYNRDRSTVTVRGGKGNKTRVLPIDDGAQDALEDWIIVRGDEPGRMFWGVNKGGNISNKRLNVRAVNELYEKRAAVVNVENTHFHDLRRSFISDLLDNGVDVATVSKLAGHADPRTTLRYDRRKMETRRKAINTLHIPYTRRPMVKVE